MLRLVGVYGSLGLTERPSSFVGLHEDEYTCFCFDEAFAFILSKLKSGEEPTFSVKNEKTYSRPSQVYGKYGRS